jgi:hypothetical protein
MTRYLSNLALIIAGAFLVVATQAFSNSDAAWVAFGVAIGLTAVSGLMLAARGSIAQRALGAVGVVLGAWTIVASLVFSSFTASWLGFASGIAYVALGVAGLTDHELRTERVVHSLAVAVEVEDEALRDAVGVHRPVA